MASAVSGLYDPLIGRDLEAIPAAVAAYRRDHTVDELFVALARFAVLAFAPTEHSRHALSSFAAVWQLRDELGSRLDSALTECARYASEARLPWSEPPILDESEPGPGGQEELRAAAVTSDRARGERWLAGALRGAALVPDLSGVCAERDDGGPLQLLAACVRLEPPLGEKGRYALYRTVIVDLTAAPHATSTGDRAGPESVDGSIRRAVALAGSVDAVAEAFRYLAAQQLGVLPLLPKAASTGPAPEPSPPMTGPSPPLELPPVYRLSRDYGHLLAACALPADSPIREQFIAAVRHNLLHGEGFEEWSFA